VKLLLKIGFWIDVTLLHPLHYILPWQAVGFLCHHVCYTLERLAEKYPDEF
jgi:hypothetical protein